MIIESMVRIMKKKNNKGFAISTVIYGLSIMGILLVAIMMATMSANRTHTTELAKSIEEELNRISRTEVSYTFLVDNDENNMPLPQQYIVPEGQSGFYRIELWGSQGGGATGGYGAYTSGIIKLQEGDSLYFYVGRHQATGGGRETDVRIVSGAYDSRDSYSTRIMAAAGGGANPTAYGGTLYGYNANMMPQGGAIDTAGANPTYGLGSSLNNTNGSLIGLPSTYAKTTLTSSLFTGTVPGPVGTGGGGDGYYPSSDPNVGGTSYISGYAGVETIKSNGKKEDYLTGFQTTSRYMHQKYSYNEETGEESFANVKEYYFIDGRMIAGVNDGDGKVKIERLSLSGDYKDLKRNSALKTSLNKVIDCVDSTETGIKAARISIMSGGRDLGKLVSTSTTRTINIEGKNITQKCWTASGFGNVVTDEIVVWHLTSTSPLSSMPPKNTYSGKDIKNHTVEVETTDGRKYLKTVNKATELSETETVNGIRISAYQTNGTDTNKGIINGDYYIMPITSEGKVITAPESETETSNPIYVEPLKGYRRQKWSIERITNKAVSPGYVATNPATYEYKITEQARYKSLTIFSDQNLEKNLIKADRAFNNYARDVSQIWKITPVGDGTYTIATAAESPLHGLSYTTGNLTVQTNQLNPNLTNQVFIGRNNLSTERYRLISVDYLSGN